MKKNKIGISLVFLMFLMSFITGMVMYMSDYTIADVSDNSSESSEVIVPSLDLKVVYDISEPTNKCVTATLVSNRSDVIVTNNEGLNTYTFIENGEFVFEYLVQGTQKKDSITAKVDWIDKEIPTASIVYDYSSWTNGSVKATLIPSEDVIILNNDNSNPLEYIFKENGDFIFKFVDIAGNQGSAVAHVDWIDKILPSATLTYDILGVTKSPVTVTVSFDEDGVIILNNENKNYYEFKENGVFEFEFIDKAGNLGSIKAEVNWIEKNNRDFLNNNVARRPNRSDKGSETKTSSNDNKHSSLKIYKTFSVSNIELEMDSTLVDEELSIKKVNLDLNGELLEQFNRDCEYFEVYLENKNNEKINFELSETSVLTILLDGTKVFKNVFMINDGKPQLTDFKIVNGNRAEIKDATLGKYLVQYEEKVDDNLFINTSDDEDIDDSQLDAAIVICSCVIGVVLVMVLICVLIKSY